ncbi:MAG TPA: hypothetical protein VKV18_04055 [Chthonomonas sp.]|nr:hypothetical protein [Chthonomonas sp.]HLI47849.1 hypothetical protein [Chthonomonas sp.]
MLKNNQEQYSASTRLCQADFYKGDLYRVDYTSEIVFVEEFAAAIP